MTAQEKAAEFLAHLRQLKSPQDRLAHVIQIGRNSPGLPVELKVDATKLEGCLSNLWLHCESRDGHCFFRADSDSAVVKGLAVVICELHSGLGPGEISKVDLEPLRDTGLWQQLTPNRRTGLSRLMDRIQSFARAMPQ